MRQCALTSYKPVTCRPWKAPLRLVPAILVMATAFTGPAFAQAGAGATPAAQPKPPAAQAAPAIVASKAPEPTFDEGTAQRIVDAFIRKKIAHIEKVTWMLAIERGDDLTRI